MTFYIFTTIMCIHAYILRTHCMLDSGMYNNIAFEFVFLLGH